MFSVLFFMVLIGIICYLLFITRTNEKSFILISKTHIRKLQYWFKNKSIGR